MLRFIAITTMVFAFPAIADQSRIGNYDTARDQYVYSVLYERGGRTLYCDREFTTKSGLQVEHVLPASWMKDAAGCTGKTRRQCRTDSVRFNYMEADLHNLWPALGAANQARSNYSFGVIGQDTVHNWGGFCDFEVSKDRKLIEPRPEIRGEIARMVLYMVGEYGIRLPDGQAELMVAWHCRDNAPSVEEIRRNSAIAAIQGTRNQFIDNPRLLCEEDALADPDASTSDNSWEDCQIKGNISRNGDRIYHVPGSSNYNSTKINESAGERWFCSEAEALDAGWRARRN